MPCFVRIYGRVRTRTASAEIASGRNRMSGYGTLDSLNLSNFSGDSAYVHDAIPKLKSPRNLGAKSLLLTAVLAWLFRFTAECRYFELPHSVSLRDDLSFFTYLSERIWTGWTPFLTLCWGLTSSHCQYR
jgi:hypothetical protein